MSEEDNEKYISGECCINCNKSQKDCNCTDEEIDVATSYMS